MECSFIDQNQCQRKCSAYFCATFQTRLKTETFKNYQNIFFLVFFIRNFEILNFKANFKRRRFSFFCRLLCKFYANQMKRGLYDYEICTQPPLGSMLIRRSAVEKKRSRQNKCIERLPHFMPLIPNKALTVGFSWVLTKHENPTKFGAHIVYTPIVKEVTVSNHTIKIHALLLKRKHFEFVVLCSERRKNKGKFCST